MHRVAGFNIYTIKYRLQASSKENDHRAKQVRNGGQVTRCKYIYIKKFTMFRIILIRLQFWYRISRKVKNLAVGSEYPSKSHFALVTELRSQKFSL